MQPNENINNQGTNHAENELKQKEIEIQKKKAVFFKTVTIGAISLFGLIIVYFGTTYAIKYFKNKNPKVVVIQPTPTPTPSSNNNSNNQEVEWEIYQNDDLKVSFEYPSNAEVQETNEEDRTKRVEIIYTGDDLEGYVFRLSLFTTESRDLNEIANVKRESFVLRCPHPAKVGNVIDTDVNGISAKSFEVTNCEEDYKITYLNAFGTYYEFAQVYKGDIGYKQQYKMTTEEILQTSRFYPMGEPMPDLPYEIYTNKSHGISFKHEKLSSDCCEITGPASNEAKRLVSLYDPDSYENNTKYDGIGLFVDGARDFNEYVEGEKAKLVDDYKVVRGMVPETSEEEIEIDGVKAVVLKGYTWEGNTLIYFAHKDAPRNRDIFIFSIKNLTGEDFEEKTNYILNSFKFL